MGIIEGIRTFFHKIKIGFVRMGESTIPYVSEKKLYGNCGEDEFTYMLSKKLPSCKIKRNIIISTTEGNAEIDCLVLYQNKLFAIEVKRWKGCIIEQEDGFIQEKIDRWTGETHVKYLSSPFKQLARAIYLLKKQVPGRVWINPIVFFEDDELESVSTISNHAWFLHSQPLIEYILNDGEVSFGMSASNFFDKCTPADYLYEKSHGKSLLCIINRDTLQFKSSQGIIYANNIISIRISHHWSYDKLHIKLNDGTERVVTTENAKIQVNENGYIKNYALCKLDYIELGI